MSSQLCQTDSLSQPLAPNSAGVSYRAVSEAYILFTTEPNPPVPGFSRGLQRITQTLQVTQNQFTSEASAEFFDVDGNLVIALCVTATGQRMSLDN